LGRGCRRDRVWFGDRILLVRAQRGRPWAGCFLGREYVRAPSKGVGSDVSHAFVLGGIVRFGVRRVLAWGLACTFL
jgi:hypothetical protein